MNQYSIEKSKSTILKTNYEFKRRVILQYYLDNAILINAAEREILEITKALEPENIGIIDCLLNDGSHLNTLRLVIGLKITSNKLLANLSKKYLSEKKLNIAEAENYYMIDKYFDELSEVELDVDRGLQPNLL